MRHLLVLALLGACSSHPSNQVTGSDAKNLLIDRNWLDNYPQSSKDHLFVYRFVPNMGGGVFQDRTLYKGTFELFSFSATADEIEFKLHETDQTVSSPYTIEKVDGPEPFDLKLTIGNDPRGPKVYYGIRGETDLDGHLLQQRLDAIE